MKKGSANTEFKSNTGKGARIPFPISVVCWVDLLGYGAAMSAADFNPLHPSAKAAINRLRRFHRIVSEHSHRNFPTLVMNDGAAAYRDLSLRSNSVTCDFLTRAWSLHTKIIEVEKGTGHPGARMVIAAGFRMLGRRAGLDERRRQFRSIINRLNGGRITAEQAITEGERLRSTFDVIPQLQANFAFTKAYLAEQGGSKAGFSGPRCFIDLAILSGPVPFLTLGKRIDWKHPTLSIGGEFSLVTNLKGHHDASSVPGLRNGLEVGIHLANDPDLLATLTRGNK